MAVVFPIIFGKPLVFWLGLVTGVLLLGTAFVGILVVRGKTKFKNHLHMVYALMIAFLAHAIVAMLMYF